MHPEYENLTNGLFSHIAVDRTIWRPNAASLGINIDFDLKKVRDISKVVVKSFNHSKHYALEIIEVYAGENGEYKLVTAVPGYEYSVQKTHQVFEIPLNVKCSKLRVRVRNTISKYISLSEIEIYEREGSAKQVDL